jgi:flagellar motor switch protein FliN/FliY
MRCGIAEPVSSPSFDPSSFFISDLELIDTHHPPIVIAIERTALKALEAVPIPKRDKEPAESDSQKLEVSDFHRIGGLSLPVSVSVGSTKLEVKNVLRARTGSVISLSKDISDPVELLVDGVIVARGELVVVKGNYGFRVKQIVTRSQRISLYSN